MNIRTPVTALTIALGLACTTAFAAQPLNARMATSNSPPAAQSSQDGYNGPIVSIVRKVYFFNKLDRNHNGQLTRAEIPKDMVSLRRDFMRADFDGNGQLSPAEIVLYERGEAPQYVGVNHAYVFVFNTGHKSLNLSMAK